MDKPIEVLVGRRFDDCHSLPLPQQIGRYTALQANQ